MRLNASSCAGPPVDKFTNELARAQTQQPAELDLTVDRVKETVTGSIWLPPASGYSECGPPKLSGCGKLSISDGRTNGNALTFTTHVKLNGSRIPTRWSGEVRPDGSITLQQLDTLPCKVGGRIAGNGPGGLGPLGLRRSPVITGALVYRRGEDPKDRKANSPAPGATGKWWTLDGGQVTALDIKVNDKGRLTGSVSYCGGSPQKIEKGSLRGKTFNFETAANIVANLPGRTHVWSGELINDDTLTLSSSVSPTCQLPSGISLVFTRQGKDRKYFA